MKNSIYILCGTILLSIICIILLCVCTPSAVLTPFTKQMVDLYVSAGWAERVRIEIISGRIDERYIYFFIDTPPYNTPVHGTYCGSAHHRGHEVILYGDSIDGLFWSSSIPAREIEISEDDIYEDDSGYWYIGIDMLDTTIVPEICVFKYDFPFPIDTINSMLKSLIEPNCYPQISTETLQIEGNTIKIRQ